MRINDCGSRKERKLLEEVAPTIVDPWRGDDSGQAQRGDDKIRRNKSGCASFRGPAELNRSAAEDLGSGSGVYEVTQLMHVIVVVPGERDEAKGQSRHSKHMSTEVRARRCCGHFSNPVHRVDLGAQSYPTEVLIHVTTLKLTHHPGPAQRRGG